LASVIFSKDGPGNSLKRPSLAVATRASVATTLGVLACSPAAAQGIDYSKLDTRARADYFGANEADDKTRR
jgi:hypothetical protein